MNSEKINGNNLVRETGSRRIPEIQSWWLGDFVISVLSMMAAFIFSPSFSSGSAAHARHISLAAAAILFAVVQSAMGQVFGLNKRVAGRNREFVAIRTVASVMISTMVLSLIVSVIFYLQIGRFILLQLVAYTIIGLLLSRLLWAKIVGYHPIRALFLGGSLAEERLRSSCRIEGLQLIILRQQDINEGASFPLAELRDQCLQLEIDEIVEAIPKTDFPQFSRPLLACLSAGIAVSSFSSFMERHFKLVPVEEIAEDWFLQSGFQTGHPIFDGIKRGFDIVFGALGLICVSPVMLLAALAIKIESRGPVFYTQIRTGMMGRQFHICKLRSMSINSEQAGPQWAVVGDSRATFTGRILRMTRIDETPQFWNILRGEMSLIGPRPERPEFVEQLAAQIPYYDQRHLVKPGLTGWAQINYPYGASVNDALQKLKYDLYYVKYASVGLDLQIIFRTVGAVMKGAR